MRALAVVLVAAAALVAACPALARAPAEPSFRAECLFSHRAMDDPIVAPGRSGASHSHDFFGNRSTDAGSTAASLRGSSTSCEPEEDRAAYWVPTLLDGRGRPLSALSATFYYVASTTPTRRIRTLPRGLAMLAGDAGARRPERRHPVATWGCTGARRNPSPVIRRCPPGKRLELELRFPDCWNGRDRDSADHRRHMAYSVAGRCPAGHPLPIPQLRYVIAYPTRGTSKTRLASGPAFTAHGDFLDAWERDALRRRVRDCLRRGRTCDPYGLPE